jgi:putative transposase
VYRKHIFPGLPLGLVPEMVRKPSKSRMPALARGIICHLAIFEFGYSGGEVGKYLCLGSSGVCLAAKRGEKFLNADTVIMTQIMDAIEK